MINFYAKNITVFLIVLGCVVRIGHFVTTVTTKCGSQEQCECSYKEGSDENKLTLMKCFSTTATKLWSACDLEDREELKPFADLGVQFSPNSTDTQKLESEELKIDDSRIVEISDQFRYYPNYIQSQGTSTGPSRITYEITVETSSAPDAGCDAYVYIKITGDGGAQEFLLDKGGYNDFETGCVDTYNEVGQAVGNILSVKLRIYVSRHENWLPKQVAVDVNGQKFTFINHDNVWLDTNGPKSIIMNPEPPGKQLAFVIENNVKMENFQRILETLEAFTVQSFIIDGSTNGIDMESIEQFYQGQVNKTKNFALVVMCLNNIVSSNTTSFDLTEHGAKTFIALVLRKIEGDVLFSAPNEIEPVVNQPFRFVLDDISVEKSFDVQARLDQNENTYIKIGGYKAEQIGSSKPSIMEIFPLSSMVHFNFPSGLELNNGLDSPRKLSEYQLLRDEYFENLVIDTLPDSIDSGVFGTTKLLFVNYFLGCQNSSSEACETGKVSDELSLLWKDEKCDEIQVGQLCIICFMQRKGKIRSEDNLDETCGYLTTTTASTSSTSTSTTTSSTSSASTSATTSSTSSVLRSTIERSEDEATTTTTTDVANTTTEKEQLRRPSYGTREKLSQLDIAPIIGSSTMSHRRFTRIVPLISGYTVLTIRDLL